MQGITSTGHDGTHIAFFQPFFAALGANLLQFSQQLFSIKRRWHVSRGAMERPQPGAGMPGGFSKSVAVIEARQQSSLHDHGLQGQSAQLFCNHSSQFGKVAQWARYTYKLFLLRYLVHRNHIEKFLPRLVSSQFSAALIAMNLACHTSIAIAEVQHE